MVIPTVRMSTSPSSVPSVIKPRLGVLICSLILTATAVGVWQLRPHPQQEALATEDLPPPPPLTSSEALAQWIGTTADNNSPDPAAELTDHWNTFRGDFSTLPSFDQLPLTLRVQSLAAAVDDSNRFIIALGSNWDPDTVNEKLRPFRDQLARLAPHRVDVSRPDGVVLVEQHDHDEHSYFLIRHNGWLVMTNHTEWLAPLMSAVQQSAVPAQESPIDPALPAVLTIVAPAR